MSLILSPESAAPNVTEDHAEEKKESGSDRFRGTHSFFVLREVAGRNCVTPRRGGRQRRAQVLAAFDREVRAVGAADPHCHQRPGAVMAQPEEPQDPNRLPPRHLPEPEPLAHIQLASDRVPSAPHPRAKRQICLLQ